MNRILVVGAGLAGLRAAEALRAGGFDGRIQMVGEELHRPYDRPPLSKKLLGGQWEPDRIVLRNPDQLDALQLDWVLGRRAIALDVDTREVTLDDGARLAYDGLVLAVGSTPRRLPTPEREGLFVLRTLDDSLALRREFEAAPRRVVVIGAGFIGAEVAATARGRGLDVTVLEALPTPLVRGLGPVMGDACGALLRAGGVDLRCGVSVAALESDGAGRVAGVRLADGTTIDADVVLVGIGVTPDVAWLEGSGLTLADGIVCDASLAAGPPGIVSAGDCVRWPHPRHAGLLRLEHWTNAAEQGAHAGSTLLALAAGGRGEPFEPVPFFWSDQFDARIQLVGHAGPDDEIHVVHGSVDEGRFVVLYGRDGLLTAALGVSLPRLLMPYRALLAEGARLDDAIAAARAV